MTTYNGIAAKKAFEEAVIYNRAMNKLIESETKVLLENNRKWLWNFVELEDVTP